MPREEEEEEKKKGLDASSPILVDNGATSGERPFASEEVARVHRRPRTSLGTGIAKPLGARLDWASLLRRVYLEDALACPCGGRRRVLSGVTEKAAIVAILRYLGLPTEPPPIARARSPSFEAA